MPQGSKRKTRGSNGGAGPASKRAAASPVAGTWLRKVNGLIHQIPIKKVEGAWTGPWMMNEESDDWEDTMARLEQNLNANAMKTINVNGELRVVAADD